MTLSNLKILCILYWIGMKRLQFVHCRQCYHLCMCVYRVSLDKWCYLACLTRHNYTCTIVFVFVFVFAHVCIMYTVYRVSRGDKWWEVASLTRHYYTCTFGTSSSSSSSLSSSSSSSSKHKRQMVVRCLSDQTLLHLHLWDLSYK